MEEMAAMMESMTALRTEVLQLRGEKVKTYKKDEDDLPYTAENTPDKPLARPLFADGAWIGRGATTFDMTPQNGAASKLAASSPWPDEWERMWDKEEKPKEPPGFAQWREPPPVEPQPWREQTWEYDPWAVYKESDPWSGGRWNGAYSGGRGGGGSKQWSGGQWNGVQWNWNDQWSGGDGGHWSGGNGGNGDDDWKRWAHPLQAPDRKDVDKPSKYNGDITKWLQWEVTFRRFLRRSDQRWEKLLEKIEGLRGRPVTAADEDEWCWELSLGYIDRYKDYLNEYLMSYCEGIAKEIVNACGTINALDAWRQLAERANSLRPNHVKILHKTAWFPREGVQAKDLEIAIAQWEGEVQRWEAASGNRMDPDH